MPIVHNLNMQLQLQKIGVKAELLAQLSKQEYTIERLMEHVRFKKGVQVCLFHVPAAVITAAAKQAMPVPSLVKLRKELDDFIGTVVLSGQSGEFKSSLGPQSMVASPSEIAGIGKTGEQAVPPVPESATPNQIGPDHPWQKHFAMMVAAKPVSEATIKQGTKVPLKQATQMYQPVRGSDEASKYFLVARYEAFSVGARLKGGKLSVRVEGDLSKLPQAALQELGFGSNAGHWSVHVVVKSTLDAQRYLAVALATMGSPLTPMPDVTKIAAHGV